MNEQLYLEHLKNKIGELRRNAGLTQDQLAEKLGISYQAVSKWETGNACPDILILPELADIFGVSIDALFREQVEPTQTEVPTVIESSSFELPWEHDNQLRAVLFDGHQLLGQKDIRNKEIIFKYEGKAKDIYSHFSVTCGDVSGNVTAGDSVDSGNITGNVTAGDGVNCGNVSGNVSAGGKVSCGNVEGSVTVGDSISCGNIGGDAKAGDGITCHDISGNVTAGNGLKYKSFSGKIR